MSDRDSREQAKSEVEQRSIGREILDAAAKEMGFAVNSIRQEVVEKGWFGERVTPEVVQEWGRSDDRDNSIAGPQDFSRDGLYGRDFEIAGRGLYEHGVTLDHDHDLRQPPDHGLDRDDDLER